MENKSSKVVARGASPGRYNCRNRYYTPLLLLSDFANVEQSFLFFDKIFTTFLEVHYGNYGEARRI